MEDHVANGNFIILKRIMLHQIYIFSANRHIPLCVHGAVIPKPDLIGFIFRSQPDHTDRVIQPILSKIFYVFYDKRNPELFKPSKQICHFFFIYRKSLILIINPFFPFVKSKSLFPVFPFIFPGKGDHIITWHFQYDLITVFNPLFTLFIPANSKNRKADKQQNTKQYIYFLRPAHFVSSFLPLQ